MQSIEQFGLIGSSSPESSVVAVGPTRPARRGPELDASPAVPARPRPPVRRRAVPPVGALERRPAGAVYQGTPRGATRVRPAGVLARVAAVTPEDVRRDPEGARRLVAELDALIVRVAKAC